MACANINNFLCNVCGLYTPKNKQEKISEHIIGKYKEAFNRDPVVNQEYAPNHLCITCHVMLTERNATHVKPETPMLWKAPDIAHVHCYMCLMPSLKGKKWSDRKNIAYPTTSTSLRPTFNDIPFNVDENSNLGSYKGYESDGITSSSVPERNTASYAPSTTDEEPDIPQHMDQGFFNDLARDLNLSGEGTELLGSRLRQLRVLKKGTKTTFRNKSDEFRSMFDEFNGIVFLRNLHGLFELFEIAHDKNEWRLFIDSSVSSLKALLLHNGNVYPSIPVAYSTVHKEEYQTMKLILELINYPEHEWKIIADFKMINILMGLKRGYPKFPCYLCLWNRNDCDDKYKVKQWPSRPSFDKYPDSNNLYYSAEQRPLVKAENVLPPPLHIKLGLVTQLFKKLIEVNVNVKEMLLSIFPRLSQSKVECGIYDGPKIRDIFNKSNVEAILTDEEREAYLSLKRVCEQFLGNHRSENYRELIKSMLSAYKNLHINVTVKMHLLLCHIDQFPSNCGQFSDEQGERAHQDLQNIEKRFKGKSEVHAMGTYCWELVREEDPNVHNKKSKSKRKYFVLKD